MHQRAQYMLTTTLDSARQKEGWRKGLSKLITLWGGRINLRVWNHQEHCGFMKVCDNHSYFVSKCATQNVWIHLFNVYYDFSAFARGITTDNFSIP